MKNIFETFAIILVMMLSLLLVYLVIVFNLIDESEEENRILYKESNGTQDEGNKKVEINRYLLNLEAYSDKDVQVDARKADDTNRVTVLSSEDSTDVLKNEEGKELKEEVVDEIGLALDKALAD